MPSSCLSHSRCSVRSIPGTPSPATSPTRRSTSSGLWQRAAWVVGIALAASSAASRSTHAQEWTRFHGPNGSGVQETARVPSQLTADNIRWQVPLAGVGHAAPVLWGQRIFVQSAVPADGTQVIACLDARSGKQIWERRFSSSTYHIHDRNSFASASPTVDSERVYLSWATPEMLLVTALTHDGQDVWQVPLGPYKSQHGFGTSPIVYEDLLIQAYQQDAEHENDRPLTSAIVALDAKTGELRWRTPRKSSVASYAVPCVYQPTQGKPQLLCCSTAHGIYSVDPRNGEPNWESEPFTMRTVSSPVIIGNRAIGTTGSGAGGNYVSLVQLDKAGQIEAKIEEQAPYVPTSVARGDLLFLWSDKGIVSCVSASTREVFWRKRVGGNYSGSPVRAGGAIYCLAEDGELVVLAADKEFKELSKLGLGRPGRSTPAIAHDQLYVRTDSDLFCLGNR